LTLLLFAPEILERQEAVTYAGSLMSFLTIFCVEDGFSDSPDQSPPFHKSPFRGSICQYEGSKVIRMSFRRDRYSYLSVLTNEPSPQMLSPPGLISHSEFFEFFLCVLSFFWSRQLLFFASLSRRTGALCEDLRRLFFMRRGPRPPECPFPPLYTSFSRWPISHGRAERCCYGEPS